MYVYSHLMVDLKLKFNDKDFVIEEEIKYNKAINLIGIVKNNNNNKRCLS